MAAPVILAERMYRWLKRIFPVKTRLISEISWWGDQTDRDYIYFQNNIIFNFYFVRLSAYTLRLLLFEELFYKGISLCMCDFESMSMCHVCYILSVWDGRTCNMVAFSFSSDLLLKNVTYRSRTLTVFYRRYYQTKK